MLLCRSQHSWITTLLALCCIFTKLEPSDATVGLCIFEVKSKGRRGKKKKKSGASQSYFFFTSTSRLLILIVWLIKFPPGKQLCVIHYSFCNDFNVNLMRFGLMKARRFTGITTFFLAAAAGVVNMIHTLFVKKKASSINSLFTISNTWQQQSPHFSGLWATHTCGCGANTYGTA